MPDGDDADAACNTMLRFASLGENCELGAAQRAFGAEPIDLFRWTNTPLVKMLAILRDRFEGIADPNNLEVSLSASGEYITRNTRYGLNWHSWVRQGAGTPESILKRERTRLPFLIRKCIEDMTEGRRIFVVLRPLPLSERHGWEALEAVGQYGPAAVMYVTQGESPSVRRVGERLLHGTVPAFAPPERVLSGVDGTAWLSVCRQAEEMACI